VIGNRLKRHDLGSVAKHLGLPDKGDFLTNVRGMSRADIIANGLWEGFSTYCAGDTDRCREIFKRLVGEIPDEELLIHDQVLRMAVDPVLHADVTVLAEHHADVVARKETILARAMLLGVESKADLMSNQKFAGVLQGLGVDPPWKISPLTGQKTWAFAKSDEEFQALREHENPYVAELVEARLGYKSTIEETRAARLLNIGQLTFPHHGEHMLPIALRIAGARTHRLSGDWKCNFQNLGRGSRIRDALVAPPGNLLVAADAAQIEARFLAWYCGQTDLLELFRSGVDVYAAFASRLFGMTVHKDTHPVERFLGKTAVLGCGYGCGYEKFMSMVKTLSALAGEPLDLPAHEALRIINTYRQVNDRIKWKWEWLNQTALTQLAYHGGEEIVDGPVTFRQFEVTGPNGLKMHYPGLHRRDGEWYYDDAGVLTKLYGGKLIENLMQHLARVYIMQVALRMIPFALRLGARLVLQAHDQLVYCVQEQYVELLKRLLHTEMTAPPQWASGLPLATDVKVGAHYGVC